MQRNESRRLDESHDEAVLLLLLEHMTNEYVCMVQGREYCRSHGTPPCHWQVMEADMVWPCDSAL